LETIVTTQPFSSSSSSLVGPAWQGHDRPLWRRVIEAMVAGQERKADREIARYLRGRRNGYQGEFRLELERRFLGQ
jgi:hypothetical protein